MINFALRLTKNIFIKVNKTTFAEYYFLSRNNCFAIFNDIFCKMEWHFYEISYNLMLFVFLYYSVYFVIIKNVRFIIYGIYFTMFCFYKYHTATFLAKTVICWIKKQVLQSNKILSFLKCHIFDWSLIDVGMVD